MASPRALIEMVVDGAAESRRRIETVGDALRRMNNESLQRISGQIGDVSDRYNNLQSTIGKVTGFAIAGVSLATLGSKIGDVLGSMGELDDLSQKIGSSVESLSKIQKVTKAFGVDFAGSVDPALVKLAKGLTTVDDKSSKTAKALAALGVSATTMSDPSEVLIEVAKNLQRYEDGAAKAAVVSDLFGKSGADLLPFFNDLAETVDDFSTVSAEAVGQAAALQDKFGMLGVRTDEIFTAITVAALPAFSDLADGFSDVLQAQDGLVNSGEIAGWADDLAVGFSRVADVAVLLPRVFSAVSSSFKVVAADVSLIWAAAPANMAVKYARGGSPLEDLKRAAAERNGILEEANKKYDDLWNKPANQFEQAVLKRISNRTSDVAPPESPGAGKGQLNYSSSGDDGANDAKRAADAYSNLTAAIQAKITASKLELSTGVALEPSQQEQLKLTEQLAGLKGKLTPIQQANAESMIKEHVNLLEVIESNKRAAEGLESYNKVRAQYETSAAKVIEDAMAEATRNEQLALTYGKTKGALEAFELARLESQLAQRASTGLTLDEITNLEKLIAAKKRSATALGQVDKLEAGKKAAESLDEFLDPAKAQSFGEALRESLGGAGTALSALSATFDGFTKRQAEFDKQRENAKLALASGQKTEMQYMQDLARLNEMETKNRLSGYGDMAGAAAGFFGEQSRGYQALMTVSKVFHAAELAMTMAELVPKGIAAVLNQGSGDPYSAFARMAAMGALVAGLGVAIGGMSGSSGPSLSESRQKQQGTGTVLGSDAKSGSIARALEQIEQSTLDNLGVSNDMLISLRNIESEIGRFASLLVRTTGVTGDFGKDMNKSVFDSKAVGIGGAAVGGIAGAAAGAYVGMGTSYIGAALGGPVGMAIGAALGAIIGKTFVGKALGSIFGGKQTVEDTGFAVDKTDFRSIAAGGLNAMQYADVKKDGGWFSKDKYTTKTEGLGEEGNRQISSVLTSLYDTVYEAGKMLGYGADTFSAQLSSFVVDIGKVSLKGLSDDEIQEELEGVFSKVGDDLAKFGVAGLDQFQKVGEGYLETLARVATNYTTLDAIMASIGSTFGATGMASLDAREQFIDMSGGIGALASQVSSFAQNFLTEAERLAPVRKYVTDQLAGIGMAWVDSTGEFKNAALGIDKTTEAGAKQFTVMMSLAEAFAQVYPATEDLSKSMKEIVDERRDLQSQLDQLSMTREQLLDKERNALDESNRPLLDRIRTLTAEADAEAEVAGQRASLQDQLDQLTMTRAQQLERERNALDESNRPLWDRIQALQAETTAVQSMKDGAAGLLGGVDDAFSVLERVVDREKSVLQKQVQTHTDAANRIRSVSDSLRSTIDSMRGPGQEVVERARAQSDLRSFVAIARAGGMLPDSNKLQAVLSTLTQDASAQFASFADYQADFYSTKNTMADLASISDAALTTEEQTIETLEKQLDRYDAMLAHEQEQIDILKGININGLSSNQALEALRMAVLQAKANPLNSTMSAVAQTYQSTLGRGPDAAGQQFWLDKAAQGVSQSEIQKAISSSSEATLQSMYQATLGRPADAAGLQYWMSQANAGTSYSDIQKALQQSEEAKKLKIPGYDAGGDHGGGWRIVGENGPELEATGPSRIFNARQTNDLMSRLMQPASGSDALVAEVRALRAEVAMLRETNSIENRAIAGGALAAADHLDAAINGDKPLAMKVIPA